MGTQRWHCAIGSGLVVVRWIIIRFRLGIQDCGTLFWCQFYFPDRLSGTFAGQVERLTVCPEADRLTLAPGRHPDLAAAPGKNVLPGLLLAARETEGIAIGEQNCGLTVWRNVHGGYQWQTELRDDLCHLSFGSYRPKQWYRIDVDRPEQTFFDQVRGTRGGIDCDGLTVTGAIGIFQVNRFGQWQRCDTIAGRQRRARLAQQIKRNEGALFAIVSHVSDQQVTTVAVLKRTEVFPINSPSATNRVSLLQPPLLRDQEQAGLISRVIVGPEKPTISEAGGQAATFADQRRTEESHLPRSAIGV